VIVLVIGGGISGLACAWRLRQRGIPVLLLERGPRFGGVIDRREKDGFNFDVGPQSFSATPPLAKLIDELGLAGEVLRADPRAPRYILLRGHLVRAPLGPADFFATPLIGWRTKLRILGEPFARTHPPPGDESIASFIRRKFGGDLLTNLVAPFVSGVYAGDPEKLSLASAFPRLRQLEEKHGSIIRGALKSRRKRGGNEAAAAATRNRSGAQSGGKNGEASATGQAGGGGARPSLCNFKRGLAALPEALADKLGAAAVRGAEITVLRTVVRGEVGAVVRGEVREVVHENIRRNAGVAAAPDSSGAGAFHVAYDARGVAHALDVSAIVVATPTSEAGELLAGVEPRFASLLGQIEYAGVAQVCMGYRAEQIRGASADRASRSGMAGGIQGFGFLVPRTENLRTLGTVWNSSLFPERFSQSSMESSPVENSGGLSPMRKKNAREGTEGAPSRGGIAPLGAVFTSFLGGATDPDIGRLSEAEIAEIAQAEFSSIMGTALGVSARPAAIHVARWVRALPQYNLGHARIADELRQLCAATPGIFLAGNYLAGPSLGACVEQANNVAEYVARFVGGDAYRPGPSEGAAEA
jgi:protoporphyrinogen/coproporphyrinogen III oxidase